MCLSSQIRASAQHTVIHGGHTGACVVATRVALIFSGNVTLVQGGSRMNAATNLWELLP
jgi:hypothetical protein